MKYSMEGLRVELVLVTPELARHLLDSCRFELQRDLSETHIDYLINEAQLGRFLRGTQVHFGRVNGELRILNGNHTLEVIARSGIAIPLVLLYEDVDAEDVLGRLYARHDIHRIRDWKATLKATKQFEKFEQHEIAKVWVSTALYAVPYVVNDLKPPNTGQSTSRIFARSRDERITALENYHKEVVSIARACEGARTDIQRLMRRRPLFAAFIAVMRHQQTKATEFISSTAMDDGLRAVSPQKQLLEWLRKTPMVQQTLPDHFRAFELCWNAFMANEDVERMRFSERPLRLSERPLRLTGTPIGGQMRIGESATPVRAASQLLKTGVRVNGDGSKTRITMVGNDDGHPLNPS